MRQAIAIFFEPVKLSLSVHIEATASSDERHKSAMRQNHSLLEKIAVALGGQGSWFFVSYRLRNDIICEICKIICNIPNIYIST